MGHNPIRHTALCALLLACTTGFAHAGDRNTVVIIQENTAPGLPGNTLQIDQTEANDSSVRGPNETLLNRLSNLVLEQGPAPLRFDELTDSSLFTPAASPNDAARQSGSNNRASITIEGDGGVVLLTQSNSDANSPQGNVATISALSGTGIVVQLGDGNNATLDVGAGRGLISQSGDGLTANLTVEGSGNGAITQRGSDNSAAFQVLTGTSATLNQSGTGLNFPETSPVQVFSTNPGNITITQTGL